MQDPLRSIEGSAIQNKNNQQVVQVPVSDESNAQIKNFLMKNDGNGPPQVF